jgi:hypothetical protein
MRCWLVREDTINDIVKGALKATLEETMENGIVSMKGNDSYRKKIHCRCDIKVEYIAQTLDELGVHLQHVQDPTKPASHAAWIDCFLKASGPEEDMKLYNLSMCVQISDQRQ